MTRSACSTDSGGGFSYDRMYLFDPSRRLIVEHKFLLGDDRVPAFCALSRLQLHEILLGAAERAGVESASASRSAKFMKRRTGSTYGSRPASSDSFDCWPASTASAPPPAASGRHRVRAAPVRLRRLAGAGAAARDVRGMEFLQGIGSKTGAMPLATTSCICSISAPRPPAPISPEGPCAALQGAPGAVRQLRHRDRRIAQRPLRHRVQPDRAADAAVALVPRTGRDRRRRRAHLCRRI